MLARSWSRMYEVKKENPTNTGIMSHTLQAHLWMFTSSGENKTKTNKKACEINQRRQVWRNTGQNTNMQDSSSESGRRRKEDVIVTKYPSLPALAFTEITVSSNILLLQFLLHMLATFPSQPFRLPSTLKHCQCTLQTFKMYVAFPHECLGNYSYVKRPEIPHPSEFTRLRALWGSVLSSRKGGTVKSAWTRAGLSPVLLSPSRRKVLLFLS